VCIDVTEEPPKGDWLGFSRLGSPDPTLYRDDNIDDDDDIFTSKLGAQTKNTNNAVVSKPPQNPGKKMSPTLQQPDVNDWRTVKNDEPPRAKDELDWLHDDDDDVKKSGKSRPKLKTSSSLDILDGDDWLGERTRKSSIAVRGQAGAELKGRARNSGSLSNSSPSLDKNESGGGGGGADYLGLGAEIDLSRGGNQSRNSASKSSVDNSSTGLDYLGLGDAIDLDSLPFG